MEKMSRNIAFLTLFSVAIGAHILALLLGIKDITIVEKRALAPLPVISSASHDLAATWSSFPKAFEAYFNDHFALRNRLIHDYYLLKVKLFKQKIFPTQRVLIGKDGWWFSAGGGTVMEDYQRFPAYTNEELAAIQRNLDALNDLCKRDGITFIVVVPPNKETVYAEFMPGSIPRIGEVSRLDQFLSYGKAHGHTPIMDLRQLMLAGKETHQVYLRTDTHWNDYGAHIAYRQVMSALQQGYPGMQAHPLVDFKVQKRSWAGNLVYLLTMQSEVKEEIAELVPLFARKSQAVQGNDRRTLVFTSTDQALPKALIFGDSFSFSTAFAPFLAEHFSRVFIRHYGYLEQSVEQYIAQEYPDVVILEIVERNLIRLEQPLEQKGGEDTEF
jgi:hypothetical protein